MSEPPVLLLDIDGCVNIDQPGAWPGPASMRRIGGRFHWMPELVDRIRALNVEVRWCTTWCSQADQLERIFHLPPLGRAFEGEPRGIHCSDAKLKAARAVVAEGRALVWTDDDEVPTSGPVFDELTTDGRALLIRPDSRGGLRPEHMAAIEAFCATREEAST